MEKIEHNAMVYGKEAKHKSFETLKKEFKKAYGKYQKIRDLLHRSEFAGKPKQDKFLNELISVKEKLSEIVLAVYKNSTSLEEFGNNLNDVVAHSGNVSLEDIEAYITGSYIYPPSLTKKDIRSPIESIYATYENLKIIVKFAKICKRHSDGIILSGTNSWGIFSAIEGKNLPHLIDLGLEQKNFESISDIDFFDYI